MLALAIIGSIAPVVFGLFAVSILYDQRHSKNPSKIIMVIFALLAIVSVVAIWLFYVRIS